MPIAKLKDAIPILDVRNVDNAIRFKGVLNQSTGLRDTDWGTREFGVRDPDGNGLIFYREV